MQNSNNILTAEEAGKKLKRMALEVAERNLNKQELVLLGIKDNGCIIAREIARHLQDIFPGKITVLELQINKKQPLESQLSSADDLTGKVVILIDDVANSGRTMLYALRPVLQQLPESIQTLALVERTHKQFPVAVDYIGMSVSTTLQQNIVVEIDNNKVAGAWLK